MKFRIYIYCILVSLLALPVFADVNNDPCLVGWWNFNDGGAKDGSQYGHDGVVRCGAKIIYDAQRGMVLHNPSSGFDYPSGGHSGYVDCGGGRTSMADPCTWADIAKSYTVLFWVKSQVWWWPPWPGTVSNRFEKEWQAIFTKGSRTSGQIFLGTVGTHGRISFRARGLLPVDQIYGGTFVDDGYWHHVAAICDYNSVTGETTLRLYVDGYEELASPVVCTGGSLSMSISPIHIAGSHGLPTRNGEVYMDDVRLYRRALTEAEILEVIDEPIPSDLTGDSKIDLDDFRVLAADWMETDYTIQSDTGKMVAHWDFEGAAGSKTIVDSINGYTGSIVGSASQDGSGSVELSGGLHGPYIDLGANVGNVIAKLNEYTIIIDCDWYGNAPSPKGWQRLATFSQAGTSEYALFTYVSVNQAYMRYIYRHAAHDETTNTSGTDLKPIPSVLGRHQIAITFTKDYANYGCTQLYMDGRQWGFRTQAVPVGSIGSTFRNYIGKGPYDYNSLDPTSDPNMDQRFYGKIHDVRIYERRLAAQDINDVYNGWSTTIYQPLDAAGNLSDNEPTNSKRVDFKDLAVLVGKWLQDMPLLKE
jgi:hypothetical protein